MKANHEAFTDALADMAKDDIEETLLILTGCFVSLTLEYMARRGHKTDGAILIDGGKNRDITIHAIKGEKEHG